MISKEVLDFLCKLEENGYDEVLISGEKASAKRRNTHYTSMRIYIYKGKMYAGEWNCTSYYDGKCEYNTNEECTSLKEV